MSSEAPQEGPELSLLYLHQSTQSAAKAAGQFAVAASEVVQVRPRENACAPSAACRCHKNKEYNCNNIKRSVQTADVGNWSRPWLCEFPVLPAI